MTYVDAFLLPIPKTNVAAYRKIAQLASRIWREYGALDYRECVGDDLKIPPTLSFSASAGAKKNETVVFASSSTSRARTATRSTRR